MQAVLFSNLIKIITKIITKLINIKKDRFFVFATTKLIAHTAKAKYFWKKGKLAALSGR